MAWQVVMIATEERVDELSGLMWSLGTLGVEVRDQRGHNEDDHLVNRVEVRASFAHRVVADEAMTAVEALGPERSVPTWTVEVPDDAGLDAWRPYAKVERAGAFVIRPSWVPSIHPPEEASVHPRPNDLRQLRRGWGRVAPDLGQRRDLDELDRKSTRLNSSH